MNTRTKRAALVIAAVLAFAVIYSLRSRVVVTDSGGIGAVSAGFAEAIIELVVPLAVGVLVLFFYMRRRRRAKMQQSPASRAQ